MNRNMKFIHLRRVRRNPDNGNSILLSNGGATIAYLVSDEVRDDGTRGVYYAIAKCNEKDNFCKDLGRKIAAGRAEAGKGNYMTIPDGLPRGELRELLKEKYYGEEERFDFIVRSHVK
jgi:hypothetical protein